MQFCLCHNYINCSGLYRLIDVHLVYSAHQFKFPTEIKKKHNNIILCLHSFQYNLQYHIVCTIINLLRLQKSEIKILTSMPFIFKMLIGQDHKVVLARFSQRFVLGGVPQTIVKCVKDLNVCVYVDNAFVLNVPHQIYIPSHVSEIQSSIPTRLQFLSCVEVIS